MARLNKLKASLKKWEVLREKFRAWRAGQPQPSSQLFYLPVILGLAVFVFFLYGKWSDVFATVVPDGFEGETADSYRAGVLADLLWSSVKLMLLAAIPVVGYFLLVGYLDVPVIAVAVLCVAITVVVLCKDLQNHLGNSTFEFLGQEEITWAYPLKLILTAALLLSPIVLVASYRWSSILVRYTIRSVLVPFFLCTFGITSLWVIFDLADNLPDFKDADTPLPIILQFYLIMIPKMIIEIVPVGLLMAMLYALGKLSKSNEIISILGSGRSLMRVLLPCFSVGLYASFVCFVMSYYWAPKADGMQESMIRAVRDGAEQVPNMVVKQLYRNHEDHRTWYIGALPFDLSYKNKMKHLWVVQEDEKGNRVKAWVGKNAVWEPNLKEWWIYWAQEINYRDNPAKPAVGTTPEVVSYTERPNSRIDIEGWSETPWKIFSSTLEAEYLSVPELSSYLLTNEEFKDRRLAPYRSWWHYRMANPWRGLVIVLVAAPLSIVFSRRGILGNVAVAIFFFVAMFFLDSLFLALVQGEKIGPVSAAWVTNIIFAAIGFFLLWMKSSNRTIWLPTPSNLINLFRRTSAA